MNDLINWVINISRLCIRNGVLEKNITVSILMMIKWCIFIGKKNLVSSKPLSLLNKSRKKTENKSFKKKPFS